MEKVETLHSSSCSSYADSEEMSAEEFFEEEVRKLDMCDAEEEDEIDCVLSHIYQRLNDCAWESTSLAACNWQLSELFKTCETDKLFAINRLFVERIRALNLSGHGVLLEVYAPYLQQIPLVAVRSGLFAVKPICAELKQLYAASSLAERETLAAHFKRSIPQGLSAAFEALMSSAAKTPTKNVLKMRSQTSLEGFELSAQAYSTEKLSSAFKKTDKKPAKERKENYTLVVDSFAVSDDILFANIHLDLPTHDVCKALF